jgi:hypothetical protein
LRRRRGRRGGRNRVLVVEELPGHQTASDDGDATGREALEDGAAVRVHGRTWVCR